MHAEEQALPFDHLAEEVRLEFQTTLGIVHIALVNHYGLSEGEASELETDLYLWFQRFCQRPGSKSPRESRQFLLVAACRFAREYQRYVVQLGERSLDTKLRDILDREPEDVVHDFSRSLELLRHRYTGGN